MKATLLVIDVAMIASPLVLSAELRYTIHTQEHSAPRPGFKPPEDRTDTYIVGSRGARVESTHVDEMAPPGATMLGLPDGTVVVLDPAPKTYWRFPTVRVPVRPGASLPPGFPNTFTASGEVWIADRFQAYAGLADRWLNPASAALAALRNPNVFVPDGFVMRKITRTSAFGSSEEESIVTQIAEEAVPPELFAIPADYREVLLPDSPLLQLLRTLPTDDKKD